MKTIIVCLIVCLIIYLLIVIVTFIKLAYESNNKTLEDKDTLLRPVENYEHIQYKRD